jgi:hypothetical protein
MRGSALFLWIYLLQPEKLSKIAPNVGKFMSKSEKGNGQRAEKGRKIISFRQ